MDRYTKQKGFGLRLWATQSGGQKAFALRISDLDGKSKRKTFQIRQTASYWFDHRPGEEVQLGDYLEEARRWARDETDRTKGRMTVDEERETHWESANRRIRKITFGKAAQSVIRGMPSRGLSQAYIDRLDKLFFKHIPGDLVSTPLADLSAKQVADVLVDRKISPGNIRTLRALIGQIFTRAAHFHGPLLRFLDDLAEEISTAWEQRYDVRFPELRSLTDADYKFMLERLSKEGHGWQQRLCIRLFFKFGAPLSRVMSARWAQLVDKFWYPFAPEERVLWFEGREFVDDEAFDILTQISKSVERQFGRSEYWFPASSPHDHIKTVDSAWRILLREVGSRYYPLREFASSYRQPNTPSYYLSFLRTYGRTIRGAADAPKIAKRLIEQMEKPCVALRDARRP